MGALVPGIPLVVSRRVAFTATDRPSPLWRWKYGRPVRFLAVSEHVKSMLMRNGVPEKRISVVHDGVPLLEVSRQPGSREPSPESGVLAPGNAGDPQKGLALAQEAANLAGVALHTATNLERDLRDATVFVYITYSEGLGSGALLAMSAGVPVVASDIGGLREVICHGQSGLLVPNQSAAIAAAIRQLLDDPGLRQRLSAGAR